jgi:hypothetical protein
VIKALAGKDIKAEVAPLRKGVYADVRLSDEYEPGEAPILRHLAAILENVRRHDFGHLDQVRAGVQELIDGVQVGQALIAAAVAIQSQVLPKAGHCSFQISVLLAQG